ncbi:MAG: TolC family protein [Gemmatimonadales bacterium]|nr:TolC family protein [Gemmatimonadales bacterium]
MALKRAAPWALATICALATPLAAQPRAITLAEALRRAEAVDPQVVQAQGTVRDRGVGVRAAYSSFLPDLRTSANWNTSFSDGPSRVDPVTGEVLAGGVSSTGLNLGANASYDLFTGFRRGKDIASARAQRAQAAAGLEYERAQNRLRTTQAFVNALQAGELVKVRLESIRRAEEQFRIAIAKLATRAATVADSLQATVNLNQARLQLASEQSQLARNEAALARAVGETGRVRAEQDSSLLRVTAIVDTTALMAEATNQAPQVLRVAAAEDAARADVGAAKSQYFPSLNLTANTSFAGSAGNDYQLFNSRGLGLGMSFPLFNRFQRELQISQRRSSYETAKAQTADARRLVAASLTTQLAALRAAEERITTTQANLDAARALVRVQLERYRIGSLDIDLLSRAQETLNNAESEAVRARFDYVLAKAEIEAVIGRTL